MKDFSETQKRIIEVLEVDGDVSIPVVSFKLGLSNKWVYESMRHLVMAGKVVYGCKGRSVYYRLKRK